MMSALKVRQTFLSFFERHGHQIMPSASVIPEHDPTLMFTNAGMVPFKDYFLGLETSPSQKLTSSQHCIRAGGKHNDLDSVGYTARHHTFFEMLGNFSFGDYFKEEAIFLAFSLLTKDFALPLDKLYVTVYHDDDEAYILWKKIAGFSDSHLIRINTADNFWSMGDVGPCGPCSEIFFDHGDSVAGGLPGSPDADGDRFVEIWNLVFMQYHTTAHGERLPLPKPSIDTGAGLERLSAVLQGVHNNYDIDIFQRLISGIADVLKVAPKPETYHRFRIIADHLRSSAFLIGAGLTPSNEGRGYVLRRILRRGLRHAHALGAPAGFMGQLMPLLVEVMGATAPLLSSSSSTIAYVQDKEDEQFRRTLAHGLRILDDFLDALPSKGTLAGADAFKLYDTYGFPLDLTQDILRERGYGVDTEGFDVAMRHQQELGKTAWVGSGDHTLATHWHTLVDTLPPVAFVGDILTDVPVLSPIVSLVMDSGVVPHCVAGDEAYLLVSSTPFYPEGGGQVGDRGTITSPTGRAEVLDTQKLHDGHLIVHRIRLLEGRFTVGEIVSLRVDALRRLAIARHHSAAHLLQYCLRQILGDHVRQKGSLVHDTLVRFDFSHGAPLTLAQVHALESMMLSEIMANHPVHIASMSKDAAVAAGAMALFNEKYGTTVRTVRMGASFELCGGMHVASTGVIGVFKVLSEGSIASGVRRIEAVCGLPALSAFQEADAITASLVQTLNTKRASLLSMVQEERHDYKALQRQHSALQYQLLKTNAQHTSIALGDSLNAMVSLVSRMLPKDCSVYAQELLRPTVAVSVVLSLQDDGTFFVAIASHLSSISASGLCTHVMTLLCGKGGGTKDKAQGRGSVPVSFDDTVKHIAPFLSMHYDG